MNWLEAEADRCMCRGDAAEPLGPSDTDPHTELRSSSLGDPGSAEVPLKHSPSVRFLPLLVAFLAWAGGCFAPPAQALSHARQYAELNRAHALDADLPDEARLIAGDNARAWEVHGYLLREEAVPAELLADVAAAVSETHAAEAADADTTHCGCLR